jgi:hypothetical protein
VTPSRAINVLRTCATIVIKRGHVVPLNVDKLSGNVSLLCISRTSFISWQEDRLWTIERTSLDMSVLFLNLVSILIR